jgi:hypothetical protein
VPTAEDLSRVFEATFKQVEPIARTSYLKANQALQPEIEDLSATSAGSSSTPARIKLKFNVSNKSSPISALPVALLQHSPRMGIDE